MPLRCDFRVSKLVFVVLLSSSAGLQLGCDGDPAPFDPPATGGTKADDTSVPCTDPVKCCPKEELVCKGSIDNGNLSCTCPNLWVCNSTYTKCTQPTPTPPGGGAWNCAWSETKYECKGHGSNDGTPPGGSGWNCKQVEDRWHCVAQNPPNPTNNPSHVPDWDCVAGQNQLTCEKVPTPPSTGTPPKPPGTPPPTGGGAWDCTTVSETQPRVCQKKDENGGLPPGTGYWQCHELSRNETNTRICVGDLPSGAMPPSGGGWTCRALPYENNRVICTRPTTNNDTPPGGGYWNCQVGSDVAGTRCEQVSSPPVPPGITPIPGETCKPGTIRWCDGLNYCGWGQMTCTGEGKWPTKSINGKKVYNCHELAGGQRPAPQQGKPFCGAYYFFFNPVCCERPDCTLPPGSTGAVPPEKTNALLCDYCNPQKSNQCADGGKCIVSSSMETYCGKACTSKTDCPFGFDCFSPKGSSSKQCIPSLEMYNNSCIMLLASQSIGK